MTIDLRADLMSQDHNGYSWSLLEEINGHVVVRFEILPGDIEDYAILVKRHNVNA